MGSEYLKRNPHLKEITFYDDAKLYGDFVIKVKYDEFASPSEFFRFVVRAYVENDTKFFDWVEKVKYQKNVAKIRIKRTRQSVEDGKELMKDYGLSHDEIENIFDVLENFDDKNE